MIRLCLLLVLVGCASASSREPGAGPIGDRRPPDPVVPPDYAVLPCEADAECLLDPGFPCSDAPCGGCGYPPTRAVHRDAYAGAQRACAEWLSAREALEAWEARHPPPGGRPIPQPPACSPCGDPPAPKYSHAACVDAVCTAVPISPD